MEGDKRKETVCEAEAEKSDYDPVRHLHAHSFFPQDKVVVSFSENFIANIPVDPTRRFHSRSITACLLSITLAWIYS
jgi:hypothetical protein